MVDSFIGLYLDSPMQSWDVGSRHDRRGTCVMPTRSALLGILAAAMGMDKTKENEEENLKRLSDLKIVAYSIHSCQEMVDYHIAQNCRSADGKQEKTSVTKRHYLIESKFAVIIESGDKKILHEISEGLINPKWGGWLGRKSCIPSTPLFWGYFDSMDMFIKKIKEYTKKDVDIQKCGMVAEVKSFEDGEWTLNDVPLSFGKREYSSRRLSIKFCEGNNAHF